MEKLNKIQEEIEQHETITIFRHQFPDMDAIGSQIGLKKALQNIYPEKKIYALGTMSKDDETMDSVDDETIKNSLAIVLDTANKERIDDPRFMLAKSRIRIDHHVPVETLASLEWLEPEASATCELIALFFKAQNLSIPKEAAQYLYEGLVADNIRYTTSNTRPESLLAGAYLIEQGANVQKANDKNFGISLRDFRYETEVRNNALYQEGVLYAIMNIESYEEEGLTFSQAKEKVYALSGVNEVKAWALFTEKEPNAFNASLRSRSLDVREIAADFGGGGHTCAAGIKGLDQKQVLQIIDRLKAL